MFNWAFTSSCRKQGFFLTFLENCLIRWYDTMELLIYLQSLNWVTVGDVNVALCSLKNLHIHLHLLHQVEGLRSASIKITKEASFLYLSSTRRRTCALQIAKNLWSQNLFESSILYHLSILNSMTWPVLCHLHQWHHHEQLGGQQPSPVPHSTLNSGYHGLHHAHPASTKKHVHFIWSGKLNLTSNRDHPNDLTIWDTSMENSTAT